MACFMVPMGEAIAISIVQKVAKDKEKKEQIKSKWRLDWLSKLLWGGTILLVVDHIWHGEIVPRPPFLTAMENPAAIPGMLHEMATVGGTMAGVITATWGIMVLVTRWRERLASSRQKPAFQGK